MEIWHKRIRELRKGTDVTLKDMAQIIGVSEATVQRYESGAIFELPYKVIEAYAEKFNVHPAYIMGWTDLNYKATLFDLNPDGSVSRESINKNFEERYHYYAKTNTILLTDEEKKIIEYYRKLTDDEKAMVKRMLGYTEAFIKNNPSKGGDEL